MAAIRADVSKVLATARAQAGISESPPYSNRTPYTAWYGLVGPWCAMYVSWVFWHAGYRLPAIRTTKGAAYCPDFVRYAKDQGIWHPNTVRPKPGWIVLFDFPGDGVNRPSHIGIVERVLADGRISTWEGNTSSGGGRDGGSVVNHYRAIRTGIIGYVQVDDLHTAPPAWSPPPYPGLIRNGSTAERVAHWRVVLGALNYKGFKVGVYPWSTPLTHATKRFQRRHGLTPDGVVGPLTWAKACQRLAELHRAKG